MEKEHYWLLFPLALNWSLLRVSTPVMSYSYIFLGFTRKLSMYAKTTKRKCFFAF